ncbi:hypothetical protein [Pseudomonas aeruginosa]|uniref:hypothetical protein n=1 Tax=Pseudomonas TaxID=286 RepID=UPI0022372023|nr:hypothetical protein [Pseudomonas aeruginosa]MCW5245667.1 hypothetical protein [Pseudomonas aeruginosa]MCW5282076.1 hypothetical protein [Pseudomonas aeruginosa]
MTERLMDGWTGSRGKERSREKIKEVVRWLALFDFSNQSLLAKAYGAEVRGQTVFFRRLEESRLVVVTKAPGLDWKIYSLSQSGMEMARVLLPHLDLKRRRTPSWIQLVHAFSIQGAIMVRRDEISGFMPEKELSKMKANHLPDAVLEYKNGKKVALEVELNHKSVGRIYNIFLSHLKNIHKGHYDQVLYLFSSEQLKNNYEEKYKVNIWPMYIISERGKLVLSPEHRGGFDAAKMVHPTDKFRFICEELYSL